MAFNIATHMDYEGQHLAEKLSHIIVVAFGVIGWIVGYVNQQFSHTVMVLGVGVLLAALLTLPPWPMYRRKPLNWRKVKKDAPVEAPRSKESTKEAGSSPSAQKQKAKKAK